jgi:RimJ/RimL family protein N-acetyltransferase
VRKLPRLRLRTPRLVLRSWRRGDGAPLKEALDSSLERLRPWLPWSHAEPSTLEVIEERLAGFERDFVAGADWRYGCFAPGEEIVLGGAGLHPRQGPGILEVGYWIRSSAVGRGYATEAAAALTRCAIERHGVATVEIRCDPGNLASARIPRRLGFRCRERLAGAAKTHDGRPRDMLVWELRAAEVTPEWAGAHPVVFEPEEV